MNRRRCPVLDMIQTKKLNEQKGMSCELKEDTDEEVE